MSSPLRVRRSSKKEFTRVSSLLDSKINELMKRVETLEGRVAKLEKKSRKREKKKTQKKEEKKPQDETG